MINIEQNAGELRISYYDEKGKVKIEEIEIPPNQRFLWKECSEDDPKKDSFYRNWVNDAPVKKVRSQFINKYRMYEFLEQLPEEQKKRLFSINQPAKFYCDIEVLVDHEWPSVKVARHPITTIAFVTPNDKCIVYGTKPLSADVIKETEVKINEYFKKYGKKIEFKYFNMKNEYNLMYEVFNKAIPNMPLITGWNFIGYDWAYMYKRCLALGIDPSVASPSGVLQGRDNLPQHRLIVDYLDIYKKWDRVIDIKENFTLDYTAWRATGLKKVAYPGTLRELYEDDFPLYVFYNAVDTYLVKLIDEKISTMDAFIFLGGITGVEHERTFSPIAMTEAVMARQFYDRNKVIAHEKREIKKGQSYEGAVVFDPITGLSEYIGAFDFASLYPTTMRQYNISPETFIEKDKERDLKPGEIRLASGAIFDNSEDSVFKSLLSDYYNKRKENQYNMREVDIEIDFLKKYLKTA